MVARPETPDGPGLEWAVGAHSTGRCRWMMPNRKACGADAAASLNRGRLGRTSWWDYCPDHLYGRWIEDGQVWHYVAVKLEE